MCSSTHPPTALKVSEHPRAISKLHFLAGGAAPTEIFSQINVKHERPGKVRQAELRPGTGPHRRHKPMPWPLQLGGRRIRVERAVEEKNMLPPDFLSN